MAEMLAKMKMALKLHQCSSKCLSFIFLVSFAVAWMLPSSWSLLRSSIVISNAGSETRSVKPTLINQNTGISNGVLKNSESVAQDCDYSWGRWVYDPMARVAYNESCPDIFKGWNCIRNRKSGDGAYLRWRWQPWGCSLPDLDPQAFLLHFRHKNIGFVGDSLNRNMYVSLVCTLRRADKLVQKWRPVKADRGLTFLSYNVTVGYHRTNLLAHYARWKPADDGPLEKLGYKDGFRVDVDIPQASWEAATSFYDVLVLNTGHWWWAPEKFDPVNSPLLFFKDGKPILPPISPEQGLDLVLYHMLKFVEKYGQTSALKFLRTQSPRHFEDGDWKDRGICHRTSPLNASEVESFFALENHSVNEENRLVNTHLLKAIRGTSFHLLNVTYMSESRADAHPSLSAGKLHEDCMHWCLPGLTDSWNQLFAAIAMQGHPL